MQSEQMVVWICVFLLTTLVKSMRCNDDSVRMKLFLIVESYFGPIADGLKFTIWMVVNVQNYFGWNLIYKFVQILFLNSKDGLITPLKGVRIRDFLGFSGIFFVVFFSEKFVRKCFWMNEFFESDGSSELYLLRITLVVLVGFFYSETLIL